MRLLITLGDDIAGRASPVYADDRAAVSTTGWGHRLLAEQSPDGTWGGGLYSPKWTSTTYTLLLLRSCGLDPVDPRARRGVARLWDGARYFDGGLTAAVIVDPPEACITSMYLALACYFGVADARVDAALSWLLDNQLADGGWNCQTVRVGDRHRSFHTSISALGALAEARRVGRGDEGSLHRPRRRTGALPRPPPVHVASHWRRRRPGARPLLVPTPVAVRHPAGT